MQKIHNRSYLIKFRRRLRVRDTEAEQVFWEHVRNRKLNGLKFKRQHSICNYIVDFYRHSQKLVIELDGDYHITPEQDAKDKLRDDNLKAMGFKVLRFRNDKVLNSIDTIKKEIIENLV